jgi:hypothetical protein
MRNALQKLSLDGGEQVKDVEVEDCFDWESAYLMLADWCDELGVSPELQTRLDDIDGLLLQLSEDKTAWTDDAIIGYPAWELVRGVARATLALMPEQPAGPDSTADEPSRQASD